MGKRASKIKFASKSTGIGIEPNSLEKIVNLFMGGCQDPNKGMNSREFVKFMQIGKFSAEKVVIQLKIFFVDFQIDG